jgi:hypothetical protein
MSLHAICCNQSFVCTEAPSVAPSEYPSATPSESPTPFPTESPTSENAIIIYENNDQTLIIFMIVLIALGVGILIGSYKEKLCPKWKSFFRNDTTNPQPDNNI